MFKIRFIGWFHFNYQHFFHVPCHFALVESQRTSIYLQYVYYGETLASYLIDTQDLDI